MLKYYIGDESYKFNTHYLPFLRPMSSMTKKEEEEFNNLPIYHSEYLKVDFYNSHHLDYRGLIEKGLAIEVTKENNPYERF